MMEKTRSGLRRALALVLSVLLLAAQVGLPVAALAQDMASLPFVNLYYQVDGGEQSTSAYAQNYGDQIIYWAT